MTLSNNAQTLLKAIKESNLWEEKAIDVLFPAPVYSRETAADYWQNEANKFGYSVIRPVNGQSVEFFMNIEKSQDVITYEAVKELKAAGLIISKNAGYNTYYYQAK